MDRPMTEVPSEALLSLCELARDAVESLEGENPVLAANLRAARAEVAAHSRTLVS